MLQLRPQLSQAEIGESHCSPLSGYAREAVGRAGSWRGWVDALSKA